MSGDPSNRACWRGGCILGDESLLTLEEKPITVVGALVANLVIAVAKFIAAALSGSSAMVAEGIHSVVDTGNQGLILVGVKRAQRPADDGHPLGYGPELYFWSLLVAMLLFSVGGGMSIYEGIHHLQHPGPRGDVTWSYVTLAVAFVAEGISWLIAVRSVSKTERGDSFLDKLHHSKDPTKFLVVAEDSAALAGIVTAFTGILLGQMTGSIYPDAIASIVIGVILCGTAVYLVGESKHLLIGESADEATVKAIRRLIAGHVAVNRVAKPLTFHLGPKTIVANIDAQFRSDLGADDVARSIDEIERRIHHAHPDVARIYIEAQLPDGTGGRDAFDEEPDIYDTDDAANET